MNKEMYRRLSKAERKLENTNRLRTNNSTLRIKYEGVKKLLEKKDKEIERLNNIIKKLEVDLRNMYLTFGEFSEEYTENCIKKLKEELKYTIPIVEHNKTITKHLKEIERLNNIIKGLEKWLDKKEKLTFNSWNKGIHEVQRKLQELKGDDK